VKDAAISSDKVANRLKGFGIMNLQDVQEFDGCEPVEEERSYHSSPSDEPNREDGLNAGFTKPKATPASVILR